MTLENRTDDFLKNLDRNEFCKHEDVPYVEDDFAKARAELPAKLEKISSILCDLVQKSDSESKDLVAKIVIILAQNQSLQFWNDDQNVMYAGKLMSELREKYQLFNEKVDRESTIMYRILQILNQKLDKKNWLGNPMAMHSFFWCLDILKIPNLSDYLDLVFSPPLLFMDHYIVANRLHGLKCLSLILDGTSSSELRMYGRADVYYDAVYKLLYVRDTELIHPAFLCALKLAKTVEKQDYGKWTKVDDVFQMLLGNMEMESHSERKIIYLDLLDIFVDELEIGVVAHSGILLRIFRNYLELSQGEISLKTLQCLIEFMRTCWIRLDGHKEEIARMLLRFLVDRESAKEECDKCRECLEFLGELSPDLDIKLLIEKAEEEDFSN